MATISLAARAYQKSFDVRPYTTLAFTNGTLSAIGDAVAQSTQIIVRLISAESTMLPLIENTDDSSRPARRPPYL